MVAAMSELSNPMPATKFNGKVIDAVIVGAGLFGSIIAKALREQGRNVVILDAKRENAGSKPAACLMKPSWFSSMGKAVYEPALSLLDQLYGVQDIDFVAGKVAHATVHWIPPSRIMDDEGVINAEVTSIVGRRVTYWDNDNPLNTYRVVTAPLVVVAAGVWCNRLVRCPEQLAQMGVAFLRPLKSIRPFITPWAPYKQLVAFNRGDGLWASDGTAILEKNWTDEHVRRSFERCLKATHGKILSAKTITGLRPYAKGHKICLLEELQTGLWVASGGAKNGTLAAGWCAHEITRRTS